MSDTCGFEVLLHLSYEFEENQFIIMTKLNVFIHHEVVIIEGEENGEPGPESYMPQL